jgi:YVTN family beta-propeller protein
MHARLRVALGMLVLVAALPVSARAAETRPVLLVGNNWDGTTDILDVPTYQRLRRVNVIPDHAERMAEKVLTPGGPVALLFIRTQVGEGHDQFNDDVFASPDGRTLYVSRPTFADVVAIDLATGKIVWRTPVDGAPLHRADHMAISPDGTRLAVSAQSVPGSDQSSMPPAEVVDIIDTATGKIVGKFPSGSTPHENNYSRDGKRIFHASIGRIYTPTDDPSMDATKGERWFQIVDADTLQVVKRIHFSEKLAEFGRPNMSDSVRPMALSPDERFVYAQLSFFHGFVEYDLQADKVTRVADLPIPPETARLRRDEYILDSAHHGIAMDGEGAKLCVAGTMSNYAAIVSRADFTRYRIHPLGARTYWSTTSVDGKHCYVSVAGDDTMSIISYDTEQEVARVPVGDHPQRARPAEVATSIFGAPALRRLRPRSLSLRARPVRDRRAPFRFRFSGRLGMPVGTRGVIGCSGTVRLAVHRGAKEIARARAPLHTRRSACVYARTVRVPARAVRGGRRPLRLKAAARFLGNSTLLGRSARTIRLRVR